MPEEKKKKGRKGDEASEQQAAKSGKKKSKKDDGAEKQAAKPAPPPRLRDTYQQQIIPRMMERFNYSNPMQVPRVLKVVVNMGVGDAISNPKLIEGAMTDLEQIAGQKPSIRRARLSVSNFKLRAGTPVGCAVTMRRARMWEFLDRLLTFAVPRIRDFRGLQRRGFDGRGNFTFGLKEQLIFPEIDYDTVDQVRGMDISIVTTAETDEEAFELLSGLGMPFTRPEG